MPSSEPEPETSSSAPLAMVHMDKVVKRFGDNVVLDQLDLSVQSNEKVVIIGPSGSGKTTILRVLMTLERPEDGVIWVDGRPPYHQERDGQLVTAKESHVRDVRRAVPQVLPHYHLFPPKTIRHTDPLPPPQPTA